MMAVQTNGDTDSTTDGSPGEFECELCGEVFESESELRAHVRSLGIVE